jgi:peroxiredoxin
MKHYVGSPAVEFALADTAGTVHRLEQCRGRWLLMVFHRHLG